MTNRTLLCRSVDFANKLKGVVSSPVCQIQLTSPIKNRHSQRRFVTIKLFLRKNNSSCITGGEQFSITSFVYKFSLIGNL